jgi:hypothetical protein
MNTIVSVGLLLILSILLISCRTYRTNLQIKSMNVSFEGGNTYESENNKGGFQVTIEKKDTPSNAPPISEQFEVYSAGKKPVTLQVSRNINLILLTDKQGNQFILGELSNTNQSCNYDCNVIFNATDKISFTSKLSIFSHWNGFHVLSSEPIFMRYQYYTLKIKKTNGEILIAKWKGNIYKKKLKNRVHWSRGSKSLAKLTIKK